MPHTNRILMLCLVANVIVIMLQSWIGKASNIKHSCELNNVEQKSVLCEWDFSATRFRRSSTRNRSNNPSSNRPINYSNHYRSNSAIPTLPTVPESSTSRRRSLSFQQGAPNQSYGGVGGYQYNQSGGNVPSTSSWGGVHHQRSVSAGPQQSWSQSLYYQELARRQRENLIANDYAFGYGAPYNLIPESYAASTSTSNIIQTNQNYQADSSNMSYSNTPRTQVGHIRMRDLLDQLLPEQPQLSYAEQLQATSAKISRHNRLFGSFRVPSFGRSGTNVRSNSSSVNSVSQSQNPRPGVTRNIHSVAELNQMIAEEEAKAAEQRARAVTEARAPAESRSHRRNRSFSASISKTFKSLFGSH